MPATAFDEAIQSFQAVLATKIPERKFDLSLDYEVNNELAFAFYARAMQEPSTSPQRVEYLKKAVAAYRRTLSIDSENVTAHHVLGLAYGAAPWGQSRAVPRLHDAQASPGKDRTWSRRSLETRGSGGRLKAMPRLPQARGWPGDRPIRGWPSPTIPVAAGPSSN